MTAPATGIGRHTCRARADDADLVFHMTGVWPYCCSQAFSFSGCASTNFFAALA